MSVEAVELPAFPVVVRDSASAEFFDAAARGELLVPKCTNCATVCAPEVRTCPSCGSAALDSTVVTGLGRLITWAVITQAPIPILAGAVPYVSAVVELDEGAWLVTRLIEPDPARLSANDRVEVDFVRSGAGEQTAELLPVFRRIVEEKS